MKALAAYLGYDLVPKSGATQQVPGWQPPVAASVVQARPNIQLTPPVFPISASIDPEIEDIIRLFYRDDKPKGQLSDCYLAEATPGSEHPQEETARTYRRRLRQLVKILSVARVSELRQGYKGLTAAKLREKQKLAGEIPRKLISDDNFVPLIRGAAGVFSAGALVYYESHGIKIANPFPSLPAIRPKHFEAPPNDFIDRLRADADRELKGDPVLDRDYKLFRLACRLGGRAQELTHITWADVMATGVWIGPRKTGKGRWIGLREHGKPDELLDYLETFRGDSGEYVIPDGDCPIRRAVEGEVKNRGMRIERRLVGWLRAKIEAAGLGRVNQCIHWLRKCVGDHVEKTQGAVARARALGQDIVAAAKKDAGIIAASDHLGNGPGVSVTTYISQKEAVIRERAG